MAQPHSLYEIQQLGKNFTDGGNSRWVLRDLSFAVQPSSTTSVWGPSGSGKSTLLNILAGLVMPDEGSVHFRAVDQDETLLVNRLSERELLEYRREQIGFVYQFFNLVPTLTLRENVLLPLELAKRMDCQTVALDRLEILGLSDRTSAFPEQLSGGEQQRAAIARALAHEPAVVLADEPTGNLDAESAVKVIELLWDEVRRNGTTLVVATHNPMIRDRSDYVIELVA